MRIKEQARIVYNTEQDIWEVHYGLIIAYRGMLFGCELWCRTRAIPISNLDEINRIKYRSMPVQEMM